MGQKRLGVMILGLLFIAPNLWAINGAQLTGFTAINESLGGSGVARPQDTSTLLINPAGMTELPKRVDFNILLAWPHSVMDSSAAAAGNAGTAGGVTSNDDPVILPGGAFNLPTPWLNERLFIGMGIVPAAGFALDYPASRLTALVTGNTYDTHTFFGLLKVVEGAAYKINDQWSVGLAVHIDHAQLETNSATAAAGFPQTAGTDRGDGAFGVGLGIGVLYKPFDFLSAGLSYTTEQWMQDFERYKDVLPKGLNFPQQLTVGLSTTPLERLMVSTDFRWINWSGAGGGLGTPVAAGGFGWQDQFIILFGTQYKPWDFLTLRAGYNFGRSAVPAGSLFTSQLASPIGKHHIGGGVGFKLGEKMDLNFSYLRTLANTVTDNGTQAGGAGAGSFTRQSVNQMNAQVGLKF